MRRHIYLQPLSREHHGTLRLARDLQRDDGEGVHLQRLLQAQSAALLAHFQQEEQAFAVLTRNLPPDHAAADLLDRMHREHCTLTALIELLIDMPHAADKAKFQTLGRLLAEHIAFEERQLFPVLQDCCLSVSPESTDLTQAAEVLNP